MGTTYPELPEHFKPAGEGRWIMSGYVVLFCPDHPLANERGMVLEHRMILHDAGISINLELLPRAEHQALHGERRRKT